jgi:putative transcriptional regulator
MADQLAPGFLIAVPQLLDPNFARSVVLLMEHNDDGAVGVIINRPSTINLGEVFENAGLGPCNDPAARVLIGGPVQPDNGMVVHGLGDEAGDSRRLTDAIFVGTNKSCVHRVFDRPGARARFVLGFASWAPGQLEREIEMGSWVAGPPDAALVFDTDRPAVWDRALKQLGIDPLTLVGGDHEADIN